MQIAMGDSTFEDVIKENAPRLRKFVRSKVRNWDDADDIVQDTFYQFLRAVTIMENPIGQVSSWLYRVAHNLIVNHGKKHREAEMPHKLFFDDDNYMLELSEIMASSITETPEMLMLRNMVWEEFNKAMAELPQEQRSAVEMTEVQGLSTREAASKMGVSVNTFLSRKHYAVLHIRKRLRSLYDEIRETC